MKTWWALGVFDYKKTTGRVTNLSCTRPGTLIVGEGQKNVKLLV